MSLTDLHRKPGAWLCTPAGSWRFDEAADDPPAAMVITEPGEPRTEPVRRPFTYAVVADARWQAATIDLRVKSLVPDSIKGRDVCILLGYRDDTHYTYVHLSNDSNGKTHNTIMKVHGKTRRPIKDQDLPEARLSDGWHRVRARFNAAGRIEVFMDDMDKPLMTATDPDVVGGLVGVGSFDDRGAFTDVNIQGHPAADAPAPDPQ